jgi:lysophospholipase L1-like esterase
MMRKISQFTLLSCVLFTFSPGAQTVNSPVKIMPLGDSITYGTSFAGGYRTRLEFLLNQAGTSVQFVGSQSNGPNELKSRAHEGHGGWKIADIDAHIEQWLNTSRPDVVLLLIGTNDLWIRSPGNIPPDIPATLLRMQNLIEDIARIRPEAQLVVGSVPFTSLSWNDKVLEYNSGLRRLIDFESSHHAGIFFADIYSTVGPQDLVDGVHPNGGGFSKMAARWFEALKLAHLSSP